MAKQPELKDQVRGRLEKTLLEYDVYLSRGRVNDDLVHLSLAIHNLTASYCSLIELKADHQGEEWKGE